MSWLPGTKVTRSGGPRPSSQARAGANSSSSAMLIRSPVMAMWSGAAATRSAASASSTSWRWQRWRRKCQLTKPSKRLLASSARRGCGMGPRWGSDRCARRNRSESNPLRIADEDAGEEHQGAADHDLEGGIEEGCIHVAIANPGDDGEFDDNDRDGQD